MQADSTRKVMMGGISLALYWGCALLAAGMDAVAVDQGHPEFPFAGFVGILVALVGFGAFPHRIASRTGSKLVRSIIVVGPASFLVVHLVAASLDAQLLDALIPLARGLLEASLGLMLAHLGSFLAHCPRFEGAVVATVAFLLGAVVFILGAGFLLTESHMIVASLALVAAIAFLLAGFDEHGRVGPLMGDAPAEGSPAPPRSLLALPQGFWPLALGLLCYSAVYGIVVSLTLDAGEGNAHSYPIQLVLLAPGIIFLMLLLRFRDSLDFRRFQWFLFAPSIIALLAIPFVESGLALVCCGVLILAFNFYDLASFVLLVDLARGRNAALTMRVFAWGRAANILGMALGWSGSSLLLGMRLDQTGAPIIMAAFLGVIILVILMTFFGNTTIAPLARATTDEMGETAQKGARAQIAHEDHRARAESASEEAVPSPEDGPLVEEGFRDRLDERCDEVAAGSGLSKREAELFKLIARGRSTSYIAEQLFLSPSTVKTHTYRIYKKLDVHSRQEVIDMIEGDQS